MATSGGTAIVTKSNLVTLTPDGGMWGGSGDPLVWNKFLGIGGSGTGFNTYVFTGSHGNDVIANFANGVDRIDLSSYNVTLADLTLDQGILDSDVTISGHGPGTIKLSNFDRDKLDASDFIFSGGSGAASPTHPGTPGADTLTADDEDNFLSGGGGNDFLISGNGNDTLDGGSGNDTLDGGKGPLHEEFSIGSVLKVWIPFKGVTEIWRADLPIELMGRFGIELDFNFNPGTIDATLPYDIDFAFPDVQSLQSKPSFVLDGSFDLQKQSAGFTTDFPDMQFTIDAIIDIAADFDVRYGVFGDNDRKNLFEFGGGVRVPIFGIDTSKNQGDPDDGIITQNESGLFSILGLDARQLEINGAPLKVIPGGFAYEFNNLFANAKLSSDAKDKGEADVDKDSRKGGDSQDTTKVKPFAEISIDLGKLSLTVPDINVESLYEEGKFVSDPETNRDNIVGIDIDIDGLATALTNYAFPPLELSSKLGAKLGPVSAAITSSYNLLDIELNAGIPLVQDFTLEPKLETKLSFFDEGGTPENILVEQQRAVVQFNDHGTFQNAQVEAFLRSLAANNPTIARDVDLFVNFDEGIPGAFTGETASVGGAMYSRVGNGPLVSIPTVNEGTAPVAVGDWSIVYDPDLPIAAPAGTKFFYGVTYFQGSQQRFQTFEVAFDTNFSAFEKIVEIDDQPLTTTGWLEDVPDLKMLYADEEIHVDVENRSRPMVTNKTGLEFDLGLLVQGLAARIGAELKLKLGPIELGPEFSLGFDELFQKQFKLFNADIVTLFDKSFDIGDATDDERWHFVIGDNDDKVAKEIIGTDDADVPLEGTDDRDVIRGNNGNDSLVGLLGADVLVGGPGNDTLDGGGGSDTASFLSEDRPSLVDLSQRNPQAISYDTVSGDAVETDDLISIENINGTIYDDTLIGSAGDNVLDGFAGDDSILGGAGDDLLIGNRGDDTLDGGAGNDVVEGGEFDDLLIGSSGADVLDGGDQFDVVDYSASRRALKMDLATGKISGDLAKGDTYIDVEGFVATRFKDLLVGDEGRNLFRGGGGNDKIFGGGDNDRLYGEAGNDLLEGGPGADLLDGGVGIDTITYENSPYSVYVKLDAPIPTDDIYDEFGPITGQGWRGRAQGDQIREVEVIVGTDYEDILFGDDGDNALYGGLGDDRLAAEKGADLLAGGAGDDLLWRGEAPFEGTFNDTLNDDRTRDIKEIGSGGINIFRGDDGVDVALFDGIGKVDLLLLDTYVLQRYEYSNGNFNSYLYDLDLRIQTSVHTGLDVWLDRSTVDITIAETSSKPVAYVTGYRSDDLGIVDWVEIAPVLAEDWYEKPKDVLPIPNQPQAGFQREKIWIGGNFGDRPFEAGYIGPEVQFTEKLSKVEGVTGSAFGDSLRGTRKADFLYGGGGDDGIEGGRGDDFLGFGEVQQAVDVFSFPSAPRTFTDFSGGGSGFNLAAVLKNLNPNESKVGRAELPTGEPGVGSFLWGGAGTDTLDMRYDRGFKFFPANSSDRAFVNLDSSPNNGVINKFTGERVVYGVAQWKSANFGGVKDGATTYGIENIIGSDNGDMLLGDDADNVIEGGGGSDTISGGGGVDTLSYALSDAPVALDIQGVIESINVSGRFFAQPEFFVRVYGAGDAGDDRFREIEHIVASDHDDTLFFSVDTNRDADSNQFRPVANLFGAETLSFDGGEGRDRIYLNGGGEITAHGGAGDDDIRVRDGGHTVYGDAGDDVFQIRDASLVLYQEATVEAKDYTSVVDGGEGFDRLTMLGDYFWKVEFHGRNGLTVFESPDDTLPIAQFDIQSKVIYELTDIEMITFDATGETIKLDNLDPVLQKNKKMTVTEDAADRQPLGYEVPAEEGQKGQIFVVREVPDTGSVVIGDRSTRGIKVGTKLTESKLENLAFIPGQSFEGSDERLVFEVRGQTDDAFIGNEGIAAMRAVAIQPEAYGGVALDIDAPRDAPGDVLTIKVTEVPTGGAVYYSPLQTVAVNIDLAPGEDGDTQTYTIADLPTPGTLFHGDGATAVPVGLDDKLTKAQLLDLKFTPSAGFDGFDNVVAFEIDGTAEGDDGAPVVREAEVWPGVKVGDLLTVDQLTSLKFKPYFDFNGKAGAFSYEVTDQWATGDLAATVIDDVDPRAAKFDGRASQTIQINVKPVNDAPRSSDMAFLLSQDTPLKSELEATEVEGQRFKFKLYANPANGELDLKSDGSFDYMPDPGFAGVDGFAFDVSDGRSKARHEVNLYVLTEEEVPDVTVDPNDRNDDGRVSAVGGYGTNDRITGSDEDDRLYGFGGRDLLEGRIGNDILDGGGDVDTMKGGLGDDLYRVDHEDDVVDEANGGGTDTVESKMPYVLAAPLENLTLLDEAGKSAGVGNAAANRLIGNDAANTLEGLAGNDTLDGGAGVDMLIGGPGDDDYVVDSSRDKVVEAEGEGTDSVISTASYRLPNHVENLTLIGDGNVSATGNGAGNTLIGNDGNNRISGGDGDDFLVGGLGRDTLIGGAGEDTLSYNGLIDSGVGRAARDVIVGFKSGEDVIDLRNIDPNVPLLGDQAFVWIGDAAFGSRAGELRVERNLIQADADGDGEADFELALSRSSVAETDFIF